MFLKETKCSICDLHVDDSILPKKEVWYRSPKNIISEILIIPHLREKIVQYRPSTYNAEDNDVINSWASASVSRSLVHLEKEDEVLVPIRVVGDAYEQFARMKDGTTYSIAPNMIDILSLDPSTRLSNLYCFVIVPGGADRHLIYMQRFFQEISEMQREPFLFRIPGISEDSSKSRYLSIRVELCNMTADGKYVVEWTQATQQPSIHGDATTNLVGRKIEKIGFTKKNGSAGLETYPIYDDLWRYSEKESWVRQWIKERTSFWSQVDLNTLTYHNPKDKNPEIIEAGLLAEKSKWRVTDDRHPRNIYGFNGRGLLKYLPKFRQWERVQRDSAHIISNVYDSLQNQKFISKSPFYILPFGRWLEDQKFLSIKMPSQYNTVSKPLFSRKHLKCY
jgi:hypothetical protein